jgi:hypothetical protein
MAAEVNVWNWEVRFFKPEQEEEFRVSVSRKETSPAMCTRFRKRKREHNRAAMRAADGAKFFDCQAGPSGGGLGFPAGASEFRDQAEPAGLVVHLGTHGFKAKDAPERLTIGLNGADVGFCA